MNRMVWVILGGLCVGFGILTVAYRVYHVAKNVWAMQYAFSKRIRVLPSPGVVTLNGIVAAYDGRDCPVKVTLQEVGKGDKEYDLKWEQTSRRVKAYPFEILLPEIGARVMVEPGEDVLLRSVAITMKEKMTKEPGDMPDWKSPNPLYEFRRRRMGTLEAGDRAIVTGVLSEKRETELVATEYRSQKVRTRIEYVLRPLPGEPMRIDAESLLDEFEEYHGNHGKLLVVLTTFSTFFYLQMLGETPLNPLFIFGWAFPSSMFIMIVWLFSKNTHRPWFTRPTNSLEPRRITESAKTKSQ